MYQRGRRAHRGLRVNRFSYEAFGSGDDSDDGRSITTIEEEKTRDASPTPQPTQDRRRSEPVSPSGSDVEVPRRKGAEDFKAEWKSGTYREWFFTIICTDGIDSTWRFEPDDGARVEGARYQLEKGETNDTLHFQGVVRFRNPVTFKTAKSRIGVTHAHIERVRNWEDALAYCSKEDTRVDGPWDYGRPEKRPGERSDKTKFASALLEAVEKGTPKAEVIKLYPEAALMYASRITNFLGAAAGSLDCGAERTGKVRAAWLWGSTGTYKTRTVRAMAQTANIQLYEKPKLWWDGYSNHHIVLFDDFEERDMDLVPMLRMLDGENMPLPVKGSHVYPKFFFIIFTSILYPRDLYQGHYQSASWLRRLDGIPFFRGNTIYNMNELVPFFVKQDIISHINQAKELQDKEELIILPGEEE